MALHKREQQEAELKKIMGKDLGSSNPVFSPGAIAEMQKVFYLYTDAKERKIDIRDIVLTANSLGLDAKFNMAFHLLEDIAEAADGNTLDFETFIRELTHKIVRALRLRETPSTTWDAGEHSTCWTSIRTAS